MNLSAIYHISADNFCYPLDESRLVIKLQTAYDIDKAELVWGDPFKFGLFGGDVSWDGTHIDMKNVFTLQNHKIWQSIVEPMY